MYLPRYIDELLKSKLRSSGAVLLSGPKFCGKTTTASQVCKSKFALTTKANIDLASADMTLAFEGERPHLIDEWQLIPDLWNLTRTIVDDEHDFGLFVLTGSTTPADLDQIYHSGAGRIYKLKMRTMSLYESKDSLGYISLQDLFEGKTDSLFHLNDNHSLKDVAFYICRGGWPRSIVEDRDVALEITKNYAATLFDFENSKNQKFRQKKQDIFRIILKSYARNISTEARLSKILNDINSGDDRKIGEDTLKDYLVALNDIFVLEDIEAWNPNFRSQVRIISTPTRHFVDPSIACDILNIYPDDLLCDLSSFGLFFEDLAIRDLRIYAEYLGGEVRHFRDGNGAECDAVIHMRNGDYALVEIKLGGERLIHEGINNLINLKKRLINDNKREPKFMMVLTGNGPSYLSEEGVVVAPINFLKA